ncbi:hypothetical protein SSTU70S_05532 [Stutzerimonas stutzeri]
MEAAVNTLIEQNPVVDVHPLEGSREQDTRVVFYSRPFIPEQPTTILVWSEWGMFEWFQRLANAKAQFSLLPGCEGRFQVVCPRLHRALPRRNQTDTRRPVQVHLLGRAAKGCLEAGERL